MEQSLMSTRKAYTTDLTDAEWNLIVGSFPVRRPGMSGRPREVCYREIVNGILYLVGNGCRWRDLPHDLPCYTTVSTYYHAWRKNSLLERLEACLRRQMRLQAGKETEPSVVILDSQSVKTTEKGGHKHLKRLSVLTRARRSKAANATSP
jgi:putative transposase